MGCTTSSSLPKQGQTNKAEQVEKKTTTIEEKTCFSSGFPCLGVRVSYLSDFVEQFGGIERFQGLTTADVCQIIKIETQQKNANLKESEPSNEEKGEVNEIKTTSYCELLFQQQKESNIGITKEKVGVAKVYVSHCWSALFLDFVDVLKYHFRDTLETVVWIDLFSLNQHQVCRSDQITGTDTTTSTITTRNEKWWKSIFPSAIEEIGYTVLVLSPWQEFKPLSRTWCLWEFYLSVRQQCRMEFAFSKTEQESFWQQMSVDGVASVEKMVGKVNIVYSLTSIESDKDEILSQLAIHQSTEAGHDEESNTITVACNRMIKKSLYQAVMTKLEKEVKVSQSTPDVILKVKMNLGLLYFIFPSFDFDSNSSGGLAGSDKLSAKSRSRSPSIGSGASSNSLLYYTKAQEQFLDCYDLRREVLGKTHPDTLTALYWLAKVHACQERYDVAKRYFTKCLFHRKEILGDLHWDTIEVMLDLTEVLLTLEEYQPAQSVSEQSLLRIHTSCHEDGGPADDDPRLLRAMTSLATACMHNGQLERAKVLCAQCLEKNLNFKGEDHPDTLTCLHNYAALLSSLQNFSVAEELLERCLEGRKKVLGEAAIPTLTTMNELTDLYIKQGRQDKAEPLLQQGLIYRQEALGESDDATLSYMKDLACFYISMRTEEKLREGQSLLIECYLLRKQQVLASGSEDLTQPQIVQLLECLLRTYGPTNASPTPVSTSQQPLPAVDDPKVIEFVQRFPETKDIVDKLLTPVSPTPSPLPSPHPQNGDSSPMSDKPHPILKKTLSMASVGSTGTSASSASGVKKKKKQLRFKLEREDSIGSECSAGENLFEIVFPKTLSPISPGPDRTSELSTDATYANELPVSPPNNSEEQTVLQLPPPVPVGKHQRRPSIELRSPPVTSADLPAPMNRADSISSGSSTSPALSPQNMQNQHALPPPPLVHQSSMNGGYPAGPPSAFSYAAAASNNPYNVGSSGTPYVYPHPMMQHSNSFGNGSQTNTNGPGLIPPLALSVNTMANPSPPTSARGENSSDKVKSTPNALNPPQQPNMHVPSPAAAAGPYQYHQAPYSQPPPGQGGYYYPQHQMSANMMAYPPQPVSHQQPGPYPNHAASPRMMPPPLQHAHSQSYAMQPQNGGGYPQMGNNPNPMFMGNNFNPASGPSPMPMVRRNSVGSVNSVTSVGTQ